MNQLALTCPSSSGAVLGHALCAGLERRLLSACILVVAAIAVPKLSPRATHEALGVGVCWLLLTLLFEFGFGRFVQQKSWSELQDAYTFAGGNVWPIVLLVVTLAPVIARRFHAKLH